jgi:hypothetical protein
MSIKFKKDKPFRRGEEVLYRGEAVTVEERSKDMIRLALRDGSSMWVENWKVERVGDYQEGWNNI